MSVSCGGDGGDGGACAWRRSEGCDGVSVLLCPGGRGGRCGVCGDGAADEGTEPGM